MLEPLVLHSAAQHHQLVVGQRATILQLDAESAISFGAYPIVNSARPSLRVSSTGVSSAGNRRPTLALTQF
jgi:hypothetical protein